jgi:septal ring factor EnvC (AmiA/AmiB activator)
VSRPKLLLLALLAPLLTGSASAANMPVTMVKAARARVDSLTIDQAKAGLTEAAQRARLDEISRREATLTADLARRRGELSKLLGALALYRRQPPPALLVSPDKARDAVRGAILARSLTPDLTRRAQALAAELNQVAVLRRQAAAANEALLNAQSEAAERGAAIAQAVQNLPAEAGGIGDLGPLTEGGSTANLNFGWPIRGRVVRRFGDSLTGGGKAQGLSIAAKKGDVVVSPAAGTAQFVGPVPDWGIVLILKIKGAYHLVLGGLDQVSVHNGQSVAAGSPIGRLANGAGSTAELYMEVRENGAPVDPARWMSGAPLGATPH